MGRKGPRGRCIAGNDDARREWGRPHRPIAFQLERHKSPLIDKRGRAGELFVRRSGGRSFSERNGTSAIREARVRCCANRFRTQRETGATQFLSFRSALLFAGHSVRFPTLPLPSSPQSGTSRAKHDDGLFIDGSTGTFDLVRRCITPGEKSRTAVKLERLITNARVTPRQVCHVLKQPAWQ